MAQQDQPRERRPGQDPTTVRATQVRLRRRPDLVAFLVTGALIGAVVGALIGYVSPETPRTGPLQDAILLGAIGAGVFALIAAVVYLVLDRRSSRR